MNLPNFDWFVICSIVTSNNSFQCHKEMFFGYINAVGGLGKNVAIEIFQCGRCFLVSSVYYKAHRGWARRKNFQNKSSQMVGTRYIEKVLANIVFHKRSMPLIF